MAPKKRPARVDDDFDDDDPRPREKKKDLLGKLREEYVPARNTAALVAAGVALGLLGAAAVGYGATAADPAWRLYVLAGGGAALALGGLLVAVVFLLPGSKQAFEVRKLGVRFRNGKDEDVLFWDEIDYIEIRETFQQAGVSEAVLTSRRRGNTRYEVHIHSPNGYICLSEGFLGRLHSPHALVKLLKQASGKEFRSEFADPDAW
jgi:hypothetical protein